MSNSFRKPVVKDKNAPLKHCYWRVYRRHVAHSLLFFKRHFTGDMESIELDIKAPKDLMNDWDYCDYRMYLKVPRNDSADEVEYFLKFSRK